MGFDREDVYRVRGVPEWLSVQPVVQHRYQLRLLRVHPLHVPVVLVVLSGLP